MICLNIDWIFFCFRCCKNEEISAVSHSMCLWKQTEAVGVGHQLVMLWVTLVLKTRESLVGPTEWRNGWTCLMQEAKQEQKSPWRRLCLSTPPSAAGHGLICSVLVFFGLHDNILGVPSILFNPHTAVEPASPHQSNKCCKLWGKNKSARWPNSKNT